MATGATMPRGSLPKQKETRRGVGVIRELDFDHKLLRLVGPDQLEVSLGELWQQRVKLNGMECQRGHSGSVTRTFFRNQSVPPAANNCLAHPFA
jgi:hypothetical protein